MYLHNQHLVCSRHKHPVNCGGGHDKVLPEKDETATTLGQRVYSVFLAPRTNPYSYMVTVNFSIRETIILCFTFEYAGLSTNYPSDLSCKFSNIY